MARLNLKSLLELDSEINENSSIPSYKIATLISFSYELLHITMQMRLYLHPLISVGVAPISNSLESYSISG